MKFEYFPELHELQVEPLVAPVTGEYFPDGHDVHWLAPEVAE